LISLIPMEILKSGARGLGIDLTERQLEQFETYYRELVAWNARMNLTAITDYQEAQTGHFLDSLTIITALSPGERARPLSVIDIGTGAGLPGLPLKIIMPRTLLVLLEATTKKCQFLEYLTGKLGLPDTEIVNARAEDAARDPRYREKFDLALARAVAALPVLLELALPFCAGSGLFIAQKKGDVEREIEQSQKAIDILGGRLREIKPVRLKGLDDGRVLVVIEKVSPSPPGYPRRPGIPAKKPIV
jgi:16S rRNA (guanine527-N7)-methyltransferase